MITTAGGKTTVPHWFHVSVSNAGVSHRSMYTTPRWRTSTSSTSNPETDQSTTTPKCATCLTLDKSILFLPCKHIFCCETCSVKISICPICRVEITEKIKIYY